MRDSVTPFQTLHVSHQHTRVNAHDRIRRLLSCRSFSGRKA